jgi:hypothetical protein
LIQWHFAKSNIFMGKVAWNSYLTQSATENKVIHTLIIDLFSHRLGSVKLLTVTNRTVIKNPSSGILSLLHHWRHCFKKHSLTGVTSFEVYISDIFMGKVAWNSYLTQSATENKVIHTLIIDLFSHRLGSVKFEQELEK